MQKKKKKKKKNSPQFAVTEKGKNVHRAKNEINRLFGASSSYTEAIKYIQ